MKRNKRHTLSQNILNGIRKGIKSALNETQWVTSSTYGMPYDMADSPDVDNTVNSKMPNLQIKPSDYRKMRRMNKTAIIAMDTSGTVSQDDELIDGLVDGLPILADKYGVATAKFLILSDSGIGFTHNFGDCVTCDIDLRSPEQCAAAVSEIYSEICDGEDDLNALVDRSERHKPDMIFVFTDGERNPIAVKRLSGSQKANVIWITKNSDFVESLTQNGISSDRIEII